MIQPATPDHQDADAPRRSRPIPRAPRRSHSGPLAVITAAIASARTASRDGRRGIELAVEGIARLRAGDVSTPVAAVVFVPASVPDDETHAILARELASTVNHAFAGFGRPIPPDRISITLR